MSTRPSDPVDLPRNLARAQRRYELLRLVLIVAVVMVMLGGIAVGLLAVKRLEAQAAQISHVLEQQKLNDENNSRERAAAIRLLVAEQRRQLVAHDMSTKLYLSQIKTLSRVEVFGAKNQENQRATIVTRFVGPIPRGATRTTVVTVAPAPLPSPTCSQRGKNGACR